MIAGEATGGGLRDRFTFDVDSDVLALVVSREKAWALTLLAMSGLAVTLVDRQALAALAVTVTGSLQISDVGYGWLSSAFAGAYLVGSVPGARFMQKFGPRIGLASTMVLASVVIGMHGVARGYWSLFGLRIGLGLAVAPAFACATHAVHRVLPFKDRARGIGLLYMGNSLGSAICPPLAVTLGSLFGWRTAFFGVALLGIVWLPLWLGTAFSGAARERLDRQSNYPPPMALAKLRPGEETHRLRRVAKNPAAFRGCMVVAAAAPITTVMLIWGTKYLAIDHVLRQSQTGHYLWLPALLFGTGSLVFGEFRARSARTRAHTRPPRALVLTAGVLATLMALVPLVHGPWPCVMIASLAMGGAGGLYTLATTDMLALAPRGSVPATTGLTTLMQSLVYIIVSPIIGKMVETFGDYRWVMVGAGTWVIPGCLIWLAHASVHSERGGRRLSDNV